MKQIALIIVLFAAALLAGRFLTDTPAPGDAALPSVTLEPIACEPSLQACMAELPDGSQVQMQILPKDAIKPMKPLQAEVTATGKWHATTLEATGINMNMGFNRFNFKPGDEQVDHADFMLPICTLKRMQWEFLLTISDENSLIHIPFHIEIES
ncbi:hypothetical protein [Solemya velum gill symbiont]|uniref:hypothetical protein n=1 Tax=Solemya velum gill symbiont TaxID=2340 RepID=UPI00099823FD|nr:hypothetical protein [Solemya velum gill symbiont]OOZ43541.1 hypothetical protein BOW37_10510 [Solemya velum gill symbiont]OOZ44641.1 hypothetical protein BOW38_11190 [Solemya velum gill symbiont]OOZ48373.1 hypothetical protein BOW39_11090 [Solemya velum gill symbiont]OOZ49839.1 hypothetical protein BOW40_11265 [Solemya velum gill symbiont]OOZ53196.1 hypothetical protein BOW41_11265 [Solemya velum gill symbiont]